MRLETGNLSSTERLASAALGLGLALFALKQRRSLLRTAAGTFALSLLTRSVAGHCGVKAAAAGHSSLREGLIDQWRCLTGQARSGLPGSPRHAHHSQTIDQSMEDSFPASDPPSSRLPDEPPVNAQAKWNAARKI